MSKNVSPSAGNQQGRRTYGQHVTATSSGPERRLKSGKYGSYPRLGEAAKSSSTHSITRSHQTTHPLSTLTSHVQLREQPIPQAASRATSQCSEPRFDRAPARPVPCPPAAADLQRYVEPHPCRPQELQCHLRRPPVSPMGLKSAPNRDLAAIGSFI